MSSFLADILSGSATVALAVSLTRWLANSKGADLPEQHADTNIYRIGRAWRGTGMASGFFGLLILIWSWYDMRHLQWGVALLSSVFFLIGLWISAGVVITNQMEITKKVLWHSRTFVWGKITEIRQLQSRGERAIELRSGPEKLAIDFRYNAFPYLLHEIEERTGLKSLPPS